MKKLSYAFLISLFTVSALFAQNDKRLKGINRELNQVLEASMAAGFAVAVVEGQDIIYENGFGFRDYENKTPVDANTLFAIGSSSKAFTSSLLGLLRQDGKLAFDESPIKYVPELRFYNDEMNENIIVADLMCHRTGLPRHDVSWYLFPSYDKDSLILRIQYQEPFNGIRKQWYYNNFMFLLQGVIAERITGKSWEDNIRERIFQPLNMTHSNLSIDEMEQSENAAFGYVLKDDSIISRKDYYHIAAMSPAGSINSSVHEMSNWLITWINSGEFEGEEILPKPYIDEAMSSHMVVNAALPDNEFPEIHLRNYGYGWFISSYRGHYRVYHGGNIDGFSANVCFFPSDSLGIVVLANQGGSVVPTLVTNIIADRMLGENDTDWVERFKENKQKSKSAANEAQVKEEKNRVINTTPSHPLHEYAGSYNNPGYGTFQIILDNDSLYAEFKMMKYYLNHVHYDVFEPFEVSEDGVDTTEMETNRLNFITNNAGDISMAKINFEAAVDPIEFKHIPLNVEVDESTLKSYVGDYELMGTTIKVYLKDDNTLYLFVAGQPEYALIPTARHKFSFKGLDGFKVEFLESDDQAINEMILIQPHGTFKVKRK